MLQPPKNGLRLVWLDDQAGADSQMLAIFGSLFESVHCFSDPLPCLELVESGDSETPCITILVSGRYGHQYVRDRFQPLNQVKDVYVYCMDIARHSQWAKHCDKVRCVESDLGKILNRMHQGGDKTGKPSSPRPGRFEHKRDEQQEQEQEKEEDQEQMQIQEPVSPREELTSKPPARFQDDNNMYDQLALHLLLQNVDNKDDGVEQFREYCEAQKVQVPKLQPEAPLERLYRESPFLASVNATDFTQLWAIRWFIRVFYRQLDDGHQRVIRDLTKSTFNYATWISVAELDMIKQRIGEVMIFNEPLLTYASRKTALESLGKETSEKAKYRTLFEINVDAQTARTVLFAEVEKNQVLLWFGARCRMVKIEFIDEGNPYWLIGLNLRPAVSPQQPIETLYSYYLKNLTDLKDTHRALGRLLMYKGSYCRAERWFEGKNYLEELAEIAIRRNQYDKAQRYLQQAPEESNDTDLLRAYAYLLTSNDGVIKGRALLKKIISDANDRIVRARANIGLGFISLAINQQVDQALEHFILGNETLTKYLPALHPDVAVSLVGIGYVHFARQDFGESEKCFQAALKIQKQVLPQHHPDFAKTRSGLAHCLFMRPQTMKQGLQELTAALSILLRTFHHDYKTHPQVFCTRSDIDRAQRGKPLRPRGTLLDYI